MTVSPAVTPITTSMVLAKVDEAKSMGYGSGVLGLRGAVNLTQACDIDHDGQQVRVRTAESALAVREVLSEHEAGHWLIVVTDRDEDDLGAGLLAHLIWQRLRNADPWEAVRHRFSATGIDPTLTLGAGSADLAAELLAATPAAGWPAAPAGILTRSHALGAVAREWLGYTGDAGDAIEVLRWSTSPTCLTAVATLRHDVGNHLTDATLQWIAERAGGAASPIRALLARGEVGNLVPLGVVVRLLVSGETIDQAAAHQAQLAFVRLEPRWGAAPPTRQALAALGLASEALLGELVHDKRADDVVQRLLHRADAILAEVQATSLAQHSDLLTSGLRARLVLLADAVGRAAGRPDDVQARRQMEIAWSAVRAHRLGAGDPRTVAFLAAVRVVRWLALPEAAPGAGLTGLAQLASDHLSGGAWVDSALDDVHRGVDDAELSPALSAVEEAARSRRRAQERRFAAALAGAGTAAPNSDLITGDHGPVWYLERLLAGGVIPLARTNPVLLLVMDGMSAATALDVVEDATGRLGWIEAALPGGDPRRRAGALALLPSLTEVSRASLLCGRLTRGQQGEERAGYGELTRQAGKIDARLFHKKAVDTTAAGWSVSHEVGDAIDDLDIPLVTVVLNTIDDALDRSDPSGTVWTADAVKHLETLLARAAAAGRTVVMTADHGHIVERRLGTQRPRPGFTSARSRPVSGPIEVGEVEVSGDRVLADGGRAVLAVDDTLRYGPLKAGYHGGASAAEVVVPVIVLVRAERPPQLDVRQEVRPPQVQLEQLPPQQPAWWNEDALSASTAAPAAALEPAPRRSSRRAHPTHVSGDRLFEVTPPPPTSAAARLGVGVVRSSVFKSQRKMTGRLSVTDDQVVRLLDALAEAPGSRLAPTPAAQALGVPVTRLRGAVTQVQQLLNVEGYGVLSADPATGAVVLDRTTLGEQFGGLS